MERTVLFVGMYHNKTYVRPDEKVETYNMSLAYLLAIGACFVISFILIVSKYVLYIVIPVMTNHLQTSHMQCIDYRDHT